MIEVTFNAADNTACLVCAGSISLKDIVHGVRQWVQHTRYAADINLLCDISQAHWQQAIADFRQVSEAVVERINQDWQGRKIAIVTNSYTEIALIENHLGAMGWYAEWRGFMSTEAARQWLLEPDNQAANAS
ncbi:MAG: STAS/SEC14 domain-containing protein [Pseudomonadales bacterium]|jgi:hypothetical protein|nr:STAS/SEC14 domain-containing protein [Pseudomonadales bacterium]